MVREQVLKRGVTDRRVLAAMLKTPREWFLEPEQRKHAYADAAQPIACQQTISQPFVVAFMTQALELRRDDRVLEVGAGSGYQTAILSRLCRQVYAIERHQHLLDAASRRLARLGLANVSWRCGDGAVGWPGAAPFDAVLVAAGSPDVPRALTDQLADGGRLIAPVGPKKQQRLVLLRRHADRITERDLMAVRFVPLIGASGWRE